MAYRPPTQEEATVMNLIPETALHPDDVAPGDKITVYVPGIRTDKHVVIESIDTEVVEKGEYVTVVEYRLLDSEGQPYGGILTSEASSLGLTSPASSDRQLYAIRFDVQ